MQSNLLAARVVDEQLRDISELVGIAYGIKALVTEFDVEINRITRFSPKKKKKRVDFEFTTNDNRRYFHETKGTINDKGVAKLREAILKAKEIDSVHTEILRTYGKRVRLHGFNRRLSTCEETYDPKQGVLNRSSSRGAHRTPDFTE